MRPTSLPLCSALLVLAVCGGPAPGDFYDSTNSRFEVESIAALVREGRLASSDAASALDELRAPEADAASRALLEDPDERVRAAAVEWLRRPRIPADPGQLARALEREPSAQLQWELAGALLARAPGLDSARRVVEAGRRAQPRDRHELWSRAPDEQLRALLTADERVEYLVEYRLPEQAGGPAALEWTLGPASRGLRAFAELVQSDAELLQRARRLLVPRLLARLDQEAPREDGRAGGEAALLLGYLGERDALPSLREAFLGASDFYGWESSSPDPISHSQFPLRHALEEAIVHLSGRPLEEAIALSRRELDELAERGSEGALYVLTRLAPRRALQLVAERFRKDDPKRSRLEELNMLAQLLPPELEMGEVRALLGPPDLRPERGVWRYLTPGWVRDCDVHALELRFVDGGLESAAVERAEEEPGCVEE
jgi:hypothetical protein